MSKLKINPLEKKITHKVGKAVVEFNMIEEGDKILVALSGGKDSWTLLYVLESLRKKAPVKFTLEVVTLDQGYPDFNAEVIERYLRENKFSHQISKFDIARIVQDKITEGKVEGSPCGLCARLRRGALYGWAEKLSCNKIALGHHRDDMIETLLMNEFFIGKIASMSARFVADNYSQIIIRPLALVSEDEIAQFSRLQGFPIVDTKCPLNDPLIAEQEHRRKTIKKLLVHLTEEFPNIKESLIASLGHLKPSHLLDKKYWSFK